MACVTLGNSASLQGVAVLTSNYSSIRIAGFPVAIKSGRACNRYDGVLDVLWKVCEHVIKLIAFSDFRLALEAILRDGCMCPWAARRSESLLSSLRLDCQRGLSIRFKKSRVLIYIHP